MGRTAVTVTQMSGPHPNPANMDTLAFTAIDITNDNYFVFQGNEIIIVENTNAGAQSITFTAVACEHNRADNVTKSIPAGEFVIFQASSLQGWLQTTGQFYLEGGHADVKVAVARLSP